MDPVSAVVFDRDFVRNARRVENLDKAIESGTQDVAALNDGLAAVDREAAELRTKLFAGNMEKEPLKMKLAASGMVGLVSCLASMSASISPLVAIPLAAVGIMALGGGAHFAKKMIHLCASQKAVTERLNDLQCEKFSKDTFRTLSEMELRSAQEERAGLKSLKESLDEVAADTRNSPPTAIDEDDDELNIEGVKLKKHRFLPQFLDFFRG